MMMIQKANNFLFVILKRLWLISIINKVYNLLDSKQKLASIKVLILTLVGAVIDILGLSLVLPVLAISSSPEEILTNEYLSIIYAQFEFANTKSFLIALYLLLLIVFIIRAIVFLYIRFVIAKFSFRLSRTYSIKLFNVYLYKPLDFFQKNNSSDLLRDVYVSTQQFASYLITPIIQTISEIFILIFILSGLLWFNIQVFILLIVVLVPVTMLFYTLTKSKMEAIGRAVYKLSGQLINNVNQGISGYIDVKLSGRESYFVNRFDNVQKENEKLNITKSVISEIFPKMIEFSAVLGIVIIFIYSLYFLDTGTAAMVLLLSLFGASAYRMIPSINRIMSGMLLIKQYAYLIDVIKITKDKTGFEDGSTVNIDYYRHQESIKLKNALFFYGKEARFKLNIPDFEIAKGEKLGIVGKSGSGKTTLVNLLLGFYKLDQGGILVDDKPLTEKEWPSWKKNFGYVQQDVFISDVSLKENVAFGVDPKEIDEKRVWECVKLALLEDFVLSLEEGINNSLGEDGKNMSGGQKQRLAIARSLYFNRQILIFDEATSALDNETEKEITDSIKSLSKGNMTMIIIAHRYSTLKYCDRIVEMEEGEIVSEVKYKELIERI